MLYLYHITTRENMQSISINGIKPGAGRGFGYTKHDVIYLTDDPHFICEKQLTERWYLENDAKVAKIDVTDLDIRVPLIKWMKDGTPKVVPHEFTVEEEIGPERIIEAYTLKNFLEWF